MPLSSGGRKDTANDTPTEGRNHVLTSERGKTQRSDNPPTEGLAHDDDEDSLEIG